jgi:hypothetical protein
MCLSGEKLLLLSSPLPVSPVSAMFVLLAGPLKMCRLLQALFWQQDLLINEKFVNVFRIRMNEEVPERFVKYSHRTSSVGWNVQYGVKQLQSILTRSVEMPRSLASGAAPRGFARVTIEPTT